MVLAKKFTFKKYFHGEPKPTDLILEEEELPSIQNGEFLVEAEYLSVDPYMRKISDALPLDITMVGTQVGKIIESRNQDYPVGKRIVGYMGWRTHTIMHPDRFDVHSLKGRQPYLMPDFGELPSSVSLGILGQPGLTAYFGFMEICNPKKGETLVVSGAAGAVGSIVGQIGKTIGLNVIGIAGSDRKCDWLIKKLGFDHAINYKTQDISKELKTTAPNGIDCYFDNVGGEISSTVINKMNTFGRVAVCGGISAYNSLPGNILKATIIQPAVVSQQLMIQGFLVARWDNRKFEGFDKIYKLIIDGKLRYHETITEGFEKMFDAFVGMLRGENFGKAIIKV